MPILGEINDAKAPVKLWIPLDEVEEGAIKQIRNVANLSFVERVVILPDVHQGFGATIGTVMALKGAIPIEAVGVDIGCGVMAVKTPLDPDKVEAKKDAILHSIGRSIPTSYHENATITPEVSRWSGWYDNVHILSDVTSINLRDKAMHQMGTLGSGNHFIEVCLDTEHRNVWVMLHSGSRHIGLQIAKKYTDIAKETMKTNSIELPDIHLAYISEGEPDYEKYWNDLRWAQRYALANRVEMMRKVLKDLSYAVNEGKDFERMFEVNCHHNYADVEEHFGREVIVVRKGAIRVRADEYGIVPGSMGAKSFIVKGKGNPDSLCSSAHGAGRKMSRKKAKQTFSVEDLKKQTEGVACSKDADIIDEIPGAYKSIEDVMRYQEDLVEPIVELRQVVCLKGGKG